MELAVISFTKRGMSLAESLAETLQDGVDCGGTEEYGGEYVGETVGRVTLYTKCSESAGDPGEGPVRPVESSVVRWAGEQMRAGNGILFIGACGIAVRAIAPHLTDKLHDVPVLVMDEAGKYVIPVLSGHMGGANGLARLVAGRTGAEPVMTTATDIRGKFAVDLFAKRNGLAVVNREGIAKVSARVLAGQEITLSMEEGQAAGCLPEGVRVIPYPPGEPVDVLVTSGAEGFGAALLLKPKDYVVGIGCKKGKPEKELQEWIGKVLDRLGILPEQVCALASVSAKCREPGILALCRRAGIPFFTYTPEELQAVEGTFQGSAFVKAQVGVDNVCERAALKACGVGGKLMCGKQAENGMTVAVARKVRRIIP